jgi:hypothetical protein
VFAWEEKSWIYEGTYDLIPVGVATRKKPRNRPQKIHVSSNSTTMAPREGWIKWKPSRARQIIIEDLEIGLLPVHATELSAEEACGNVVYQHMAERDSYLANF